jgi:hypothetical protein
LDSQRLPGWAWDCGNKGVEARPRYRASFQNDRIPYPAKRVASDPVILYEGSSILLGINEAGELERNWQDVPAQRPQIPKIYQVEGIRVVH